MIDDNKILEIVQIEYISGYCLRLHFNDGKIQLVDFEPFLRCSRNPMTRKYLDLELFKQFTLEYGDLLWHDYNLCFPMADLYEGIIEHNNDIPLTKSDSDYRLKVAEHSY